MADYSYKSDSVFYSIQTGSNHETGSTQEIGNYDYRMIKWVATYNNTVHTLQLGMYVSVYMNFYQL